MVLVKKKEAGGVERKRREELREREVLERERIVKEEEDGRLGGGRFELRFSEGGSKEAGSLSLPSQPPTTRLP